MDSPPFSKIVNSLMAYRIQPNEIANLVLSKHCIPECLWLAVSLFPTPKVLVSRSAAPEAGNNTVLPISDFLREILRTLL